jgi:hypothetical protein
MNSGVTAAYRQDIISVEQIRFDTILLRSVRLRDVKINVTLINAIFQDIILFCPDIRIK